MANTPSLYAAIYKYQHPTNATTYGTNYESLFLNTGWQAGWVQVWCWYFFVAYGGGSTAANIIITWFEDGNGKHPNGVTTGANQSTYYPGVQGGVLADYTSFWDGTNVNSYKNDMLITTNTKGLQNAWHTAQYGKKARSSHWKGASAVTSAGGHNNTQTGAYFAGPNMKLSDMIGIRTNESGTSWTGGDNVDETFGYNTTTGAISFGDAAV